ncbi:MAG TPA: class I SAM-dependent methyltransferase [Steroidobacteraceae bacterium]
MSLIATEKLRKLMKRQFPLLSAWVKQRKLTSALAGKSAEQIFTRLVQDNKWGDQQSVCGVGSNLEQTAEVRRALPLLLRARQFRSMLDLACGDFNWMRLLPLDIDYVGADIVASLVTENQRRYGSDRCRFMRLDLLAEKLPPADLVLCRDCLVHFSYRDVFRALANIKRSGSGFLLTTTFTGRTANHDILTGHWRPLNLQQAPFSLPPPAWLLDEQCPQQHYRDKHLGLWPVADLPG